MNNTTVDHLSNEPPIVLCETKDAIATITLNQDKTRNSLSIAMLQALHSKVEELANDDTISCIILAAKGPVFCAGHNLKELTLARKNSDHGRDFFTQTMSSCSQLMQSIVYCPKPVIAAVQGVATAAGCQLVASCDLAVASENASFATPGVNIGLFCSTPMVALSRNLSRKQAMEMLLLGEMINAQQALNWGLVNRVTSDESLLEQALSMAKAIAAKSSTTITIGKQAFYQQLEYSLSEAYDYATQVMVENMMIDDAEEGINAFIEKRKPNWKNN